MIENTSGLRPLGRAVLIQTYEAEKKEGLIQLPDNVKERTEMVEQRAVVIAAGPMAWHDEDAPRALPGDKVLVARFAGHLTPGVDGKRYRLVNDRDIFCGVTEEAA